jgi:hypothetical protein
MRALDPEMVEQLGDALLDRPVVVGFIDDCDGDFLPVLATNPPLLAGEGAQPGQ